MTRSTGDVRSNPFATRFVRPGAIPFLFPAGLDTAALVERFAANQWRGAIIGPHGSGKSTLLEWLCRELERAGHAVVRITLHDNQRRLPRPADVAAGQILVIDGYEQLSPWARWQLARRCRRCRCGLLITSHRPTRLPELYRTTVDSELLARIVARLLVDADDLISADDVRRAFSRHGQNAREALFALYDLYEARARVGLERL
jgi:DNA replication protein DnaC